MQIYQKRIQPIIKNHILQPTSHNSSRPTLKQLILLQRILSTNNEVHVK